VQPDVNADCFAATSICNAHHEGTKDTKWHEEKQSGMCMWDGFAFTVAEYSDINRRHKSTVNILSAPSLVFVSLRDLRAFVVRTIS